MSLAEHAHADRMGENLTMGSDTVKVHVSPSHLALPCVTTHRVIVEAHQQKARSTRLFVIHRMLQLQRKLVERSAHKELIALHV